MDDARGADPPRPNIVLILSDDFGYGSAGCYGADPELLRTPNIDRLAEEGRRFTDACTTSSVCSPTRYSVLTGRYCWRTSLKHEVLGTTSPLHIEPGRLNLASLLKKHGYATAAIGKWHLGYGDAAKTDFTQPLKPGPLEIGFDYHFGVPSNHGDVAGVYVENHAVLGLRSEDLTPPEQRGKNFKDRPFLGLDAPHRVDEDVMPTLTKKAVAWIEQQSADQPFFLYYTPVAVHNPVTPSAKTRGTSKAGPYGDWIHELDASVGGVLDALDRKGFTENTLVLFTSDNGGVNKPTLKGEATDALEAGLAISGPLRGGKHDVWEGGFRVPYLVRWPGHVPAETVCDETVSLVDTLATVAALVDHSLPDVEKGAEDSFNVLPAWLAQKHATPIRPDVIVHSADGNFAIRRGGWKWIEGDYHPDTRIGALRLRQDQFRTQLYDLSRDLAETTDVSKKYASIALELEALLNRYRDGGYSRRLPPPSPERAKPKPLPPAAGEVVRRESFKKLPGDPWVQVRGVWRAADGALRGSQAGGDRVGAALRAPLRQTSGDIEYDLSLPFTTSHSFRLQGSRRDFVFRITINPRGVAILRQPTDDETTGVEVLADQRLKLNADQWTHVRIHFDEEQLAVQVGETIVRAKHSTLSGAKSAFALMAHGRDVGFKTLVVRE
ncbi:MAG: arylsulfatase [Pirellulaceae bacterium]